MFFKFDLVYKALLGSRVLPVNLLFEVQWSWTVSFGPQPPGDQNQHVVWLDDGLTSFLEDIH